MIDATFVFEQEEEAHFTNLGLAIGIDFGLNNLAVCVIVSSMEVMAIATNEVCLRELKQDLRKEPFETPFVGDLLPFAPTI